MSDKAEWEVFRNRGTIINLVIAETEVRIRVFFSFNCCEMLCNFKDQGDSYRSAFAKTVFHMYQRTLTDEKQSVLSENDFVCTTDTNLSLILQEILLQDSNIKSKYDTTKADSEYERFYLANIAILENTAAVISKSLEKVSKTFEALKKPLLSSISSAMLNITIPSNNLANLSSVISKIPTYDFPKLHSAFSEINKSPYFEVQSALQAIQPMNFTGFQSALSSYSNLQFPKLASVLMDIPKPVFDIQAAISPLQQMMENIARFNENIAQTLKTPLLQMAEATQSLMASVDFSLLIYRKEWTAQRETLLKYGWFYSDELPDDIVNHIHENQEELSIEDVDKIISDYFRENNCKALKQMIKNWESLPYFCCRSRIFHEALVNHSRKYFNSSVTLLTIHTEGVITDFARTSLNNPRYKVSKAIEDIKKELAENERVSLYEFEVFSDVIEQIETAFNEGFKHSDPDSSSNRSRDKIAHGHAYEKENEVNSLKRFLYLNEVYCLFERLSHQE